MNSKQWTIPAVVALAIAVCLAAWWSESPAITRGSPATTTRAAVPDAVATSDATAGPAERVAVEVQPRAGLPAGDGGHVLRVILEGISGEGAALAKVTVSAIDGTEPKSQDTWPCAGSTSEFDLEPLLAAAGPQPDGPGIDALQVEVDHPHRLRESVRIQLDDGSMTNGGPTFHEVRIRLAEVAFWPEFTLAVRDARTRAHLEDVELRCAPSAFMGLLQHPGDGEPFTALGDGLTSPVALRGGRKASEREDQVGGIALRPASGKAPRPADLAKPVETERGVLIYARAPGYAWGRVVVDVSKGAERELLLQPGAALGLRLANVQLETYAAFGKPAAVYVTRIAPNGEETAVAQHRLDETVAEEGLRVSGLEPGDHVVSVELGSSLGLRLRHVLAREPLSLPAGQSRDLVLVLDDAPTPPQRVPLAGTLSFPHFGAEESVRLELYQSDYRYGRPDFELSLADMDPDTGALPTWRFRLEELPTGRYQVRLMPFEKGWMLELPPGGREDAAFVVPELAEVLVETVDTRTGARLPLEVIRYGYREELPGRVRHDHSGARTTVRFDGEPGRFRFWTPPGQAYVRTFAIPRALGLGSRSQDLELVPGLQSVRFELAPACTLRFEFHIGGAALPHDDDIFASLGRGIRAIGHDGRVQAMTHWLFEASEPGVYEITFEGVGADRFAPIPHRRVDVRAGETTDVIVELRRK
ncbi:MAG: hypothetical protein AB7O97_07720 [Planctomycetota bacterium]